MKKTKIFAMLLSLACVAGFNSCSDDDDVKPALQNPTVAATAGAYNSLSFEWNDVANAVQYGYRLTDSDGIAVDAGVTHDKSVTITGLKPASTYTLQVWAFASMDGDYSTPPAVTLTATTDALIRLNTPSGLTLTSENGYVYTASWNAVADAISYAYVVRDLEGALIISGTTEETSVVVKDIENGDYTFYVSAEGHDGFESGDPASADFNIDKPEEIKPAWTVKGTYYSAQMDKSWTAYMDAYDDGTYTIHAFYGVDGYNLDFAVNESEPDDMFSILNGEYVYDSAEDYYTWQVPTGLSDPAMMIAYPWDNYSYMDGDKNSGEVGIGTYYGEKYANWGYDVFTWPVEDSGMSVDDLVGTYDNHFVGSEYLSDFNNATAWDTTWTEYATITKLDDSTISVDGIFYTGYPLAGVVNFQEMTITFELKNEYYYYWYTLCDGNDPYSPAIGYINSDGSISIPDFGIYYNYGTESDPDWDWYLYGTATLTKVSSNGLAHRKCAPRKVNGNLSTPPVPLKNPAKPNARRL